MAKSPVRRTNTTGPVGQRGLLPGRPEEGIPNTLRLRQLREDVDRTRTRAKASRSAMRHEQTAEDMFPGDPERALRLSAAFMSTRDEFELIIDHCALDEEERLEVLRKVVAHFDTRPSQTTPAEKALPKAAPELWEKRDRNVSENPVAYTRRVYGRWLGKGLTRRDLRILDPQLYRALSVWMHRHPEDDMPELPPLSAVLDDLIERVGAEMSMEDLRKLGYAIDSRLRRATKS